MGSSTSNLRRNERIEPSNGSFERAKEGIVIGKHSEMPWFDSKTNTCRNVFFCGLEPCVSLGLVESVSGKAVREKQITHGTENKVQNSVEGVVLHGGELSRLAKGRGNR